MSIIRVSKAPNEFSIVNRTAAEDSRLSFKAKGIMFYLLTKPDDWTIRVGDLVKRSTDGKDAVYSGIKELKDYGYIVVKKKREGGKFIDFEYILHESPVSVQMGMDLPLTENPQMVPPFPGFPDTDKPDTDKPDTENPEHSNNNLSNIDFSNNKIIDDDKDEDIFEILESVYKEHEKEIDRAAYDVVVTRVVEANPSHFRSYLTQAVLTEIALLKVKEESKRIKRESKAAQKPRRADYEGKTKRPNGKPVIDYAKPTDTQTTVNMAAYEKAMKKAREMDAKLNSKPVSVAEMENDDDRLPF